MSLGSDFFNGTGSEMENVALCSRSLDMLQLFSSVAQCCSFGPKKLYWLANLRKSAHGATSHPVATAKVARVARVARRSGAQDGDRRAGCDACDEPVLLRLHGVHGVPQHPRHPGSPWSPFQCPPAPTSS